MCACVCACVHVCALCAVPKWFQLSVFFGTNRHWCCVRFKVVCREIRMFLCAAPARPANYIGIFDMGKPICSIPSTQLGRGTKAYAQKTYNSDLEYSQVDKYFASMLACSSHSMHTLLHVPWQTVDEWKAQFAASDKKARGALTFDEFRRAVRK
jgi:hypothetical protein